MPNPTGKGGFGDHPESINREGRKPKGYALADIIREFMESTGYEVKLEEEIAGAQLDGMDRSRVYVRSLFRNALNGSGSAMRIIRDAMDGLPIQNVRVSSGNKRLVIEFRTEDPLNMFGGGAEEEGLDIEMNDQEVGGGSPAGSP